LLEGSAKLDNRISSHFAECLTCRACTANCPQALQTDHIVVEGRNRSRARNKSRLEDFAYSQILANPAQMRRLSRLLRQIRKTGAERLLPLIGWFPGLPEGISKAPEIFPRPAGGFLHERIGKFELFNTSKTKSVAYFMSCGMNYFCPDAGEASLRVLCALGYNIKLTENCCCGLPAYIAGDMQTAARLARRNIEAFARHDGLIVSDCASCSSFLKEYPNLLGEEGKDFSARVRDFTEFAAEQLEEQPALLGGAQEIVTYHEPCHLSRYQKLRTQPRQLLKAIKGLEFRELAEADWCCGGAGTYAIKHPKLSQEILNRKLRNLQATGAGILATACPGCMMQLSFGVKKAKLPVQVMHISELLVKSLKERK
jgi:glycolate oxidase iron-sulfur subunit